MTTTDWPTLTDWFSIIGLGLDIFGGLFLAKGFIAKKTEKIVEESGSYWGYNLYMANSLASQKIEAKVGGVFLSLGFLGQILSYIIRIKHGFTIFVMMGIGLIILWIILSNIVKVRADKVYQQIIGELNKDKT